MAKKEGIEWKKRTYNQEYPVDDETAAHNTVQHVTVKFKMTFRFKNDDVGVRSQFACESRVAFSLESCDPRAREVRARECDRDTNANAIFAGCHNIFFHSPCSENTRTHPTSNHKQNKRTQPLIKHKIQDAHSSFAPFPSSPIDAGTYGNNRTGTAGEAGCRNSKRDSSRQGRLLVLARAETRGT